MKYTNKHIKDEYKFNQIGRTIGMNFDGIHTSACD